MTINIANEIDFFAQIMAQMHASKTLIKLLVIINIFNENFLKCAPQFNSHLFCFHLGQIMGVARITIKATDFQLRLF